MFGDPVVATAILDRLLHHSTVITIRGDSYRLREKRRSGLLKAGSSSEHPTDSANKKGVSSSCHPGGQFLESFDRKRCHGALNTVRIRPRLNLSPSSRPVIQDDTAYDIFTRCRSA